jgi:hypothetical protein
MGEGETLSSEFCCICVAVKMVSFVYTTGLMNHIILKMESKKATFSKLLFDSLWGRSREY